MPSARALAQAARRVKVVLTDVDGVLTNGLLWHFVDTAGELVELKAMHTQDSIALAWLAESGIKTGCISGRSSKGTEERLKLLRTSYIYQGRLDKLAVFDDICKQAGVTPAETLYMGDDIPDIPVILRAGLGVAVANARPEVKKAAAWTTRARGGEGAMREVAELLLKAQGLWPGVLAKFGLAERPKP